MSIRNEEHTDLGANHFMDSDVTLQDNGHIDATTRTRTATWLGGFTGGVQLLYYDGNNVVIGQSDVHTFGVDGTAIGRSDRTDYWTEDVDPDLFGRTTGFQILHFWAPRYSALSIIVGRAVAIGQQITPLLQELRDAGIIR